MSDSTPEQRAQYLARKIREQEAEVESTREALRAVLDEWAVELSPYVIGDRVQVLGIPDWTAQVIDIRAAAGAFEVDDSLPAIVVEVRYMRKDGKLGARTASFMDGYNYNWKLSPPLQHSEPPHE